MEQHDLRQRFARYLLAECNLSPVTAFGYEQCLLRLERFTGKRAEDISATDVRGFLRDSSYHPETKGCTVVAIKQFHRWGVLEELWPANGILGLRGPKLIRNPKPALERDEARTVLSLCKRPNDYRLAYFGLYAGLRISESASITENEWRGDKLRFTGKGRKVREVPVHPDLAGKRHIILSHSTTADSLKTSCRGLAFATGVSFSSHALRRTFAVSLAEARVSRDVIGALLGYAASVTTAHYAPVLFSEMREAIAQLSYR